MFCPLDQKKVSTEKYEQKIGPPSLKNAHVSSGELCEEQKMIFTDYNYKAMEALMALRCFFKTSL